MKRNRITSGILFLAAIFFSFLTGIGEGCGELQADTLRLRGTVWPGELQPELENRIFLDDLIGPGTGNGSGFGRYDREWNTSSNVPTMLGVDYYSPFQEGRIVLSASYIRHTPDYSFSGFDTGPDISLVSLDNYRETNVEGEAGYEIEGIKDTLFITPRIGIRNHYKSFDYNDISFGSGTMVLTTEGPFQANVYGSYAGIEGSYFLSKDVAITGSFFTSSPIIGDIKGDMSFDHERIGFSGNSIYYAIDSATSGYTMNLTRLQIGAEYHLNRELTFRAGYRYERMNHTYPDYFNLPIVISGGTLNASAILNEIITDRVFWNRDEKTEKGMIYAGVTYDIQM